MRNRRVAISILAMLLAGSSASAQPRGLPLGPAFSSPGFGAPRGQIVVIGSFGNVYLAGPASGIITPFGFGETRVSLQVIAPALAPRRLAPAIDLSGVDLDVGPPPWSKPGVDPKREVAPAPGPQPEKVVKRIERPQKPEPPPVPELSEPKVNPVEQGQRLATLGLLAFRNQDYGLAARRFSQAIDIDPTASRTYFLLGQANFALGKYRDAVQMIGLGLGLEPVWPTQPFRPRFDLYADHPADWQRHVALLEDAQSRQPNNAGYVFLLAHQRWFDDRRAEADKLFRQVRPLVGDPALVDLFLKAKVP